MRTAIGILAFFLSITASAAVRKHSLQAAMQSGLVSLKAMSNGNRFNEKGLQLELRNTTTEVLQLTVDPALIFRPDDTSYQDLVLPGSELLVVLPGKMLSCPVQSFCGKAHALAPGDSLGFSYLKQGDSTMIKVARYISKHALYGHLGQAAIWALTDHHNLDGILDLSRPKESAGLLAFMQLVTGWKLPEYFKVYQPATEAGQPALQKRKLTLATQFDIRLEQPKMLSMGVYNAAGKEVQVAFKAQQMNPGIYKLLVRFEAEGAAPGAYFLRVMDGAAVLKEQKVLVPE